MAEPRLISNRRLAEIRELLAAATERLGDQAKLSPTLSAISELLETLRYLGCNFVCVWCHKKFAFDGPEHRDAFITGHVRECAKHPLSKMIEENDRLRIELEIERAKNGGANG